MKLSEKKDGDFTPHPETETPVKAVIVDITPLKKIQSQFGEKDAFRLVFETEVTDQDGKHLCVWSRNYTPSLSQKANFRKDLKKILGRDLTPAELEEFDTDALIGKPVTLIVQHEIHDDRTFANITFLAADKSATPLTPTGKYIRVQDREPKSTPTGEQAGYRKAPAATEDEGRQPWQKVKVHVGKHKGVDLGDLDMEKVQLLIEKWLPEFEQNPKPKADDKRLATALKEVAELLTENPPAQDDY